MMAPKSVVWLALVWLAGCAPDAGVKTHPGGTNSAETKVADPIGRYTLVTINGHALPYAPPHEGRAPLVSSGTFTINADGTSKPTGFLEVAVPSHLTFYRACIAAVSEQNPYAGALVSMHGAGIYTGRYGTQPGLGLKQAEAYPELQADENFRQLQSELAETENRVAVSRQVYNDTVLTYNNVIQTFPGVVVAGPFGFTAREFFEVEEEAQREAPVVDF